MDFSGFLYIQQSYELKPKSRTPVFSTLLPNFCVLFKWNPQINNLLVK